MISKILARLNKSKTDGIDEERNTLMTLQSYKDTKEKQCFDDQRSKHIRINNISI